MNAKYPDPADVLSFWREAGEKKWFTKDDAFDREMTARFSDLHAKAAAGEKDGWAGDADGALALLIVLDQFSRNMFRGEARAFAQDAKAREIARRAVSSGMDKTVELALRRFVYLPFEHSEAIADQEFSIALFHSLNDLDTLRWALDHERIIRRFGRFPHRNKAVGRHTSPAEREFLEGGGFAG